MSSRQIHPEKSIAKFLTVILCKALITVALSGLALHSSAQALVVAESPSDEVNSGNPKLVAAWKEVRDEERALKRGNRPANVRPDGLANAVRKLALVYREQDQIDKAEALLARALELYDTYGISDTITVATVLNGLASIQAKKGNWLKSVALYQRALTLVEKALKPNDPTLIIPLVNLGKTYHQVGDYAAAEPLFFRVVKLAEAAYGPDDPRTKDHQKWLSWLQDAVAKQGGSSNVTAGRQTAGDTQPPRANTAQNSTASSYMSSNTSGAANGSSGGILSSQSCEAMKQTVTNTKVPPNASVTAAMETVMFMTKTEIDMIDKGCPPNPGVTQAQIAAVRAERLEQYKTAEQGCNAVQSGGRRCVAQNRFGPSQNVTKGVEAPPNDCQTVAANALAQMRKVNTFRPDYYREPQQYIDAKVRGRPRTTEACQLVQQEGSREQNSVNNARRRFEEEKTKPNRSADSLNIHEGNFENQKAILELVKVEICTSCGPAAVPAGSGSDSGGRAGSGTEGGGSRSTSKGSSATGDDRTCGRICTAN